MAAKSFFSEEEVRRVFSSGFGAVVVHINGGIVMWGEPKHLADFGKRDLERLATGARKMHPESQIKILRNP